jgi:deoxyribodipyrimidine photo-lyase
MKELAPAIVWFRNDLRLRDNPALYFASKMKVPLILIYIAEDHTVPWAMGEASRWWARQSLASLQNSLLKQYDATLVLRKGDPLSHLCEIIAKTKAKHLFYNHVFEPYFLERDQIIEKNLLDLNVTPHAFNGSLLNHPWDYKNRSGQPWKVFTPFWKTLRTLEQREIIPTPSRFTALILTSQTLDELYPLPTPRWYLTLDKTWQPGETGAKTNLNHFLKKGITHYIDGRDRPDLSHTSKLSPHLHFGEISPVQIWHAAMHVSMTTPKLSNQVEKFLSELAWREFSYHLLYCFPSLPEKAFKPEFSHFPWKTNETLLKKWQTGQTGYPIVDAGMRELWHTGYMHNRVRMIAASFLVKHLLQPWQKGEAWFWNTLVDADLANNAASWQWVAGSGADAAPYFRIFNPILQGKKFDPEGDYVKRWVPELKHLPIEYLHMPWEAPVSLLASSDYPAPIIAHEKGRQHALAAYQSMRKGNKD